MAAAKGNPFAALAQGDSDSESEAQPVTLQQQATSPNTPVLSVIPASPPLRTWSLLKEQDKTHTVFRQNHFSLKEKDKEKKRRGKIIHSDADHEGWVSIKKNQPMFVDESVHSSDTEQEIKKEVLMEALEGLDNEVPNVKADEGVGGMRSLLSRGQNEMTALDWAERVRASLDRAEQAHRPTGVSQPADAFVSSLGRLSFFRRTLPTDTTTTT